MNNLVFLFDSNFRVTSGRSFAPSALWFDLKKGILRETTCSIPNGCNASEWHCANGFYWVTPDRIIARLRVIPEASELVARLESLQGLPYDETRKYNPYE